MKKARKGRSLKVAELFAGVGGFRVGLDRAGGFQTVWSNQWEPPGTERKQFASRCYLLHFRNTRTSVHRNEDIEVVLDAVERGDEDLPRVDVLVGGFPCQDYSVAKPLNQSEGIQGKKGVLWWQIHRMLQLLGDRGRPPAHLVLENVDRLLKSPGKQRGRDFAIILRCLSDLGYDVEWRVINAADYGFPQKRRRVFLYGWRRTHRKKGPWAEEVILRSGVLAVAFPCVRDEKSLELFGSEPEHVELPDDIHEVSRTFGKGASTSPFRNAGVVIDGAVSTMRVRSDGAIAAADLASVLEPEEQVPERFFVPEEQIPRWRYLKGAKNEARTNKSNGAAYRYTEGALPFPDRLKGPARTILTGEGASGPSRFRHIIQAPSGRFRRLTPRELERLNGFKDDWTAGMSDTQRAFCMGNALVVGVVERIGKAIVERANHGRHRPSRR